MLILSQHLNKPGGIRIRTNSGDIWLAMQPGHTETTCRIAIDAPKEFEILRSELLPPEEVKHSCDPSMIGLLSGTIQKGRRGHGYTAKNGCAVNSGCNAKIDHNAKSVARKSRTPIAK